MAMRSLLGGEDGADMDAAKELMAENLRILGYTQESDAAIDSIIKEAN